jgi:Asp-tRNA(Asn)/Glu-tRNA(Gln) amidotransferase C subunit
LERLIVLRDKGVAVVKPPIPSTARENLSEFSNRLATDTPDTGKEFGRLKRAVDKVAKEVTNAKSKALESVSRDLPAIEESFLRQVEQIPGYVEQVANIRQRRDALLRNLDLQSMNAQSLADFLDKRDQLRDLADHLKPDEFPKEVLEFFRATRQGGATLEKFTSVVSEWLEQRGQLKNVRVTMIQR